MSALDYLKSAVTVDIDQLSAPLAESLGPFCDMTSNQALISGVVTADPSSQLVRDVIARAKAETASDEEAIEHALDLFAVLIAKSVLPHLRPAGRVHAQLSPRYSYSASKSFDHGKRLISLFASEGVPKERVCLKIPATGAGMVAASQLEALGIRTLATTLFSVDQALAAAQVGCLYVAPYFNELAVHFEEGVWKEYPNGGRDHHPMVRVIQDIICVYKGLEKKPLVMPASIVTKEETLMLGTLGIDHITVAGPILTALSEVKNYQPPAGDAAPKCRRCVER
ncbi:transaldolase, partial [Tremellales sp. Uapishka_1]